MAGIDHHLSELLTNAPELNQTPGLAFGLASGLSSTGAPVNTGAVGQSASLALVDHGLQQASQDVSNVSPKEHHSSGWFDSIGSFFHHAEHTAVHAAGSALGELVPGLKPITRTMNAPLQETQHTYRYVHDVWERHGALAALDELAIVGSGAVVGGYLGGASGAVLGGEVLGDLAARTGIPGITYKDSWNATANGEAYRENQGYKVSPGRDAARLLAYITGGHAGHDAQGNLTGSHAGLTSGATDFVFDVSLDPLLKLGSITRAARIARVTPKLADSWQAIDGGEQLGTRPLVLQEGIRPNNIQTIYRNVGGVRDAFNRIAGLNTRQVLTQYPALAPMAPALGQAKTGQEVADAFEMALTARNYSFAHYGLPHTSLTRRLLGGVGIDAPTKAAIGQKIINGATVRPDAALPKRLLALSRYQLDENGDIKLFKYHEDGPTNIPMASPAGLGKFVNTITNYQPFAFNSKTLELSGKRGDPLDPEFLRGMYSTLRYSQNAATSKAIVAHFAEADTLGEKLNILKNAYLDTFRAAGLPDESPYVGHVLSTVDHLLKQANGGIYALDKDGRIIRMLDDDGNPITRGVFINQTGQVAFPDFNQIRRAVADSKGGIWSKAAKVDDFFYKNITANFFKRLVLLSLGFAFRVSAGELIPAVFSEDARRVAAGAFGAASAKVNPVADDLFEAVPKGESQGLVGARASVPGVRAIGTIKELDEDTGEALVSLPGVDTPVNVPSRRLTVYHGDLTDDELRSAAETMGVRISREEVGHIRAAFGHALYGVSKAIGDSDYREMALLNLLAFDGHVVAPGLASIHDEPRGIQGIHHSVRKAVQKAGINLPHGAGLSHDFQLWDSGKNEFPLFWKYALDEAAGDPGIRAMARAYHQHATLGEAGAMVRNVDIADLARQIEENGGGITYDLRKGEKVTKGYAFAAHPEHERRFTLEEYKPSAIEQYLTDKAEHLAQDGHHLGVWTADNGDKVFDVARVSRRLSTAKRLGLERGEEAVADLREIERNGVESQAAFHGLDYVSEAERQRVRNAFKSEHPLPTREVSPGAEDLLPGHGGDSGAGVGERGSRVPAVTRLLNDAEERAATQAAIKADRAWFESDDPDAVRARMEMAHYSTNPEKYSAVRAEALKGLVHGQNGHVNLDALEALSQGETPSLIELAQKDHAFRPVAVKGRELKPRPVMGTLDKVITEGWDGIHAIINSLSRAPIYTMYVTDEYKMLKPWVQAGMMTKAEAHNISTVRALNRTLPLIHNTLLRSQMSLVFRNVFPFYFAQEQAYKRYGRSMFRNPVAFRKAQLLFHGMHSSGALQTDPTTGQHYFVFPGAGDVPFLMTLGLGHFGVTPMGGIPASVTGQTISLRSVVPEAVGPGVGPVMAVPLKAIGDVFPPADPYINKMFKVFGGDVAANSTITQELIPNATLRRVMEAVGPAEWSRAGASTFAMNAAWAAHKALPLWAQAEKIDPRSMDPSVPRNQLDPRAQKILAKADRFVPLPNADATDKQAAMDRIRNATHVQLFAKALFGFVSPLAPSMQVGDVKLHSELDAAIKKYGITEGVQNFLDKHPYATPDTVFQSDNSQTGTNVPATQAALEWVDSHRDFIAHNQLAAAYLIPQTPGKFSSEAYNAELALNLRQRRSPAEFLNAVYTAIGNQEFFPSLESYNAQKADALANGDSATAQQLSSTWNGYFEQLRNRNPVWYDTQFAQSKQDTAQQAYNQLVRTLASGNAPDSPMLPHVERLINDYQAYQQQLALSKAGTGQFTQTDLNNGWKSYLDQYAKDNPEAHALVYGVFRRLGSN